MLKKKILFYTDCYIFGGCEKPIFEVITSKEFSAKYDYKLFYRFSSEYFEGMRKSFPGIDTKRIKGFSFPDIETFNFYLQRQLKNEKSIKFIRYLYSVGIWFFKLAIFFYETVVLYFAFVRENSTLVHINNGGYPGALSCRAASFAAKLAGKKYILFNVNNTANPIKRIADLLIDWLVKRSVTKFITGSKASKIALFKKRKFDINKIINIYHGIRYCQSEGCNKIEKVLKDGYVCMVARFEERKGHRYVISAWHELILNYPDYKNIKLVLIGDGPLLGKIKKIALKNSLGDNILFLGHRDDYMKYVRLCLFLLNPSLEYEDLPYIILEAMSLGIPVVGTNVAGIPEEIENEKTGLIVSPGDGDALQRAILKLLSDNNVRKNMGIEARKKFQQSFTLDKMISNYISIYNSLI
ncbi:MAG: glycosyltransferase family 4 protein [Actinobacteria bacterium]|nr:glycosyltransferase family 4 protein [Actinomycetota bacterium]